MELMKLTWLDFPTEEKIASKENVIWIFLCSNPTLILEVYSVAAFLAGSCRILKSMKSFSKEQNDSAYLEILVCSLRTIQLFILRSKLWSLNWNL